MPDVFAVYRSLEQVPAGFGPAALTVGNFDGVHQGHARILREVGALARERGWRAVALTFDPHPTRIVAPDRAPRLLTTLDLRLALLEQAGLDAVVVLPFTAEVARLEPAAFVRDILAGKLGARAVVVGGNFRFGRRHAGDVKMLQALGGECGFEVRVAEPVLCRGEVVSSSRIRGLIGEGAVSRVVRMLGRPFSLDGSVVRGHGVGARQAVPTLNLAPNTEVLPARGVYVTCTRDADTARRWPSVTNIGYRPTFGGTELSIETFLLRPLEGPAPQRLSVAFWHRLRDEKKFPAPEDLRRQILGDVATAEKFLRRLQASARASAIPAPGVTT
ncbi:MAG TPA: bifunctional riboflavin kinase/FAD synthetase [Bryobacterales bacterium]|nr:bifunctional riboflavin kinase/FAD synthetase [Bryobacterales bacterium]